MFSKVRWKVEWTSRRIAPVSMIVMEVRSLVAADFTVILVLRKRPKGANSCEGTCREALGDDFGQNLEEISWSEAA